MTYHHSRDQADQIKKCKARIRQGADVCDLRSAGYDEAAIQIAFGRDPENIDPMGPNNPPAGARWQQ